jgi:flagellar basal body P-ring protein FlgI
LIPVIALCAHGGCVWFEEGGAKLDLGVDPKLSALANSAAYRDTIGAYTYYEGLRPMRVRGYGLVVGLGKNGSRDCPPRVRERLVENMYKRERFPGSVIGVEDITPERLIDDIDTAVVIVQGEIPPAASKGDRFDVAVAALPGTQTKSLCGGRLYTTELQVFRSTSPTTSISGQVLAHASGPIFLNPFSGDEAATRSNPLEGIVIGGGEAIRDRRVRLVLTEPSYQRARQIQDRINAQFTGARFIADAISPSFIRLDIPPKYEGDAAHFLALVRAVYLSSDPRFQAIRTRMLAEELVHPTAPHEQISLAFEGLERAASPVLNELYTHPKDHVSFHAAAAGLRLGDHIACDAMILQAQSPTSEYRFQAIRALGGAQGMGGAAIALRKLLHDKDPRVQIAAYEALLQRRDPTIQSTRLAGDNFFLDQVQALGSGDFIYVKRGDSRRIALFGRELRCSPPIFYRAPDGSITINAESGDEKLTILRVVVASGATSSPIDAPLELPALIELMGRDADIGLNGQVTGLGLDYTTVVRTLYHLTEDHSINARFILEQPNAMELFGPTRPEGRPESEL